MSKFRLETRPSALIIFLQRQFVLYCHSFLYTPSQYIAPRTCWILIDSEQLFISKMQTDSLLLMIRCRSHDSMTNTKTWWDNMWHGKRAQRADWALSSLFTRVTKIPVIQACSLRRKTLKSRKKPLKFDIHNLLRIARWPKKSIHIKNNFFEKTSSSSWSKVRAHQNLARCGVGHLRSIQKFSHWQA